MVSLDLLEKQGKRKLGHLGEILSGKMEEGRECSRGGNGRYLRENTSIIFLCCLLEINPLGSQNNQCYRTRDTVQRLGALAVLPDNIDSVARTYVRLLTTICNYKSRDVMPFPGLHGHMHLSFMCA